MHIVIVGAGPAGSLLAYLFARRGAQVSLIERQTDFTRGFRGEVLMPSGIEALQQVGLGELVGSTPQSNVAGLEVWRGEKQLFKLDFGPLFKERFPKAISLPTLLEGICNKAADYKGFNLYNGVAVEDLLTKNGRTAGIRTTDGHELEADYVIGADGRSSIVRAKSSLKPTDYRQVFDLVWCKLAPPPSLESPDSLRMWMGHHHFALAIPAHDGRMHLGWVIDKGTFGDLKRRGVNEWVNEFAQHLSPDWTEHVRSHSTEIERPQFLSVACDRLPRWSKQGLLLVGDAAHPMSPVGAQGLNLALRDAIVVANHFEPLISDSASAERLDSVANLAAHERMVEVVKIQDTQQKVPKLLFGDDWRSKLATNGLAPLLSKTGIGPHFFGATLRKFGFGTTDVNYLYGSVGKSVEEPPAALPYQVDTYAAKKAGTS